MTSAERNIKVYCPSHKTYFEAQTAGRIVCASDPHLLAADFPEASFWEYCCDCQRFWPSQLEQGGQGAADCAACQRTVARRYLCEHCKVLSVESDEAGFRKKVYGIVKGGAVSPACPGCGRAAGGSGARPHECGAALTTFSTARAACHFCEEPLEDAAQKRAVERGGLDFPAWVADCLREAPGRTPTFVKPDAIKARLLVKDPERRGQLVLVHDWGVPGGQLYLIPRLTRLQKSEDFYNYYEPFYDCARPGTGEVCVNEPALVERVAGGWRLVEKGELEVDPPRPPRSAGARPKKSDAPPAPAASKPAVHAARPVPEAKTPQPAVSGARAPHAQSSRPATPPQTQTPRVQPSGARSPKTDTRQSQPKAAAAAPVRTYEEAKPSPERVAQPKGGGRRALTVVMVAVAAVVLLIVVLATRRPSNSNLGSNVRPSPASNGAAHNSNAVVPTPAGGAAVSQNYSATNPPPGMVYVPGGSFTMGSSDDPYERPMHETSVGAFFIDTYEVTCGEYEKFTSATNRATPASWNGGTCPAQWARLPVTGVSWDDAEAYAAWAGKRLPTEAEWEFAARGNDGRKYPWGDQLEAGTANVKGKGGQLAEVGTYRGPSPFGAYDMSGNAWEWTATDFAVYPGGDVSLAKKQRPGKVIRGGCYASTIEQATTTYRGVWPPRGENYDRTGFRCVMDVP